MTAVIACLMCFCPILTSVSAVDTDSSGTDSLVGYEIREFENVVTTGDELLADGLLELGADGTTDYQVYTYWLTLSPNSWYYLKFDPPSSASGLDITSAYLYYGKNTSLAESVFLVDSESTERVFFTGTMSKYPHIIISCYTGDKSVVCSAFQVYALKSFDYTYDPQLTSFEEDRNRIFPNIDLTQYSATSGDFIELITIYEDITIADNYTWDGHVYLYLFNPSCKAISDGTITVPNADNNGNSATYTLTPIFGTAYSATRYSRFYKFEVVGHWVHSYEKNSDGTVNTAKRRRTLSEVTLNYADGNSVTYPYNGEFITEDSTDTSGAKSTSVTGSFDTEVNLDIDYTYYRTDTSDNGQYYHNQVDSIYFNIPNYLKENYGKLTDVQLSYRKVRTKPIFVVEDATVYEKLKAKAGTVLTTNGDSSIPSLRAVRLNGMYSVTYGITYNEYLGQKKLFTYVSQNDVNPLYYVFLVSDADAGVRENASTVSSDEIIDWMYNLSTKLRATSSPETIQGANGLLATDLYSEVGDVTVINVASLDLSAESFKENHNFFEQWVNYGFNYAIKGTSTDTTLNMTDKIIEISKDSQIVGNSDGLYFAEKDESKLRNCLTKAKSSDSSMYLVRFNVSQYYQEPIGVSYNGYSADYTDTEYSAYYATMDCYLDLHVLQLSFENEIGNVTIVPVSSNHIDCVADVTEEKTPTEIEKQATQELFAPLADWWSNLLDNMKTIGKVLAVLLGLVVLLLVIRFLTPVFRGIKSGITKIKEKHNRRK